MTVRLLVVSQYWEPAELAGGARSTGRAVAALAGPVDTWVVSGDRDVGDAGPWPTPVARSGGDRRVGRPWTAARVRYQRWDRGAGARVRPGGRRDRPRRHLPAQPLRPGQPRRAVAPRPRGHPPHGRGRPRGRAAPGGPRPPPGTQARRRRPAAGQWPRRPAPVAGRRCAGGRPHPRRGRPAGAHRPRPRPPRPASSGHHRVARRPPAEAPRSGPGGVRRHRRPQEGAATGRSSCCGRRGTRSTSTSTARSWTTPSGRGAVRCSTGASPTSPGPPTARSPTTRSGPLPRRRGPLHPPDARRELRLRDRRGARRRAARSSPATRRRGSALADDGCGWDLPLEPTAAWRDASPRSSGGTTTGAGPLDRRPGYGPNVPTAPLRPTSARGAP